MFERLQMSFLSAFARDDIRFTWTNLGNSIKLRVMDLDNGVERFN